MNRKPSRPQIRAVFLRNGARIEPDRDDLPDWVYESAFELLEQAAPAVQGEAEITPEMIEAGANQVMITDSSAECAVKVYRAMRAAAPQHTEQQPELCKYQPCGCVICTCEHETQCQGCGANHCGTHPVGQFPEPAYQQPAEQQAAPEFCNDGDLSNRCICRDEFGRRVCAAVPAPDVAGLVEALQKEATSLCDAVEKINDLPPVMYALQAGIAVNKVRDAVAALASHRSRGGE